MAGQPALMLVVVLTSFIKRAFEEMGTSREKVIVVPEGVNLSRFACIPTPEECRRQLGLPIDRAIIGYIGRFHTLDMEKGIPELVEAMASIPSHNGKEPLLLCVGGPMEGVLACIEVARRPSVPEERIRFVDRVPNAQVPLWIRVCDVVTIHWLRTEFPAYFTSPMKLFEYMAAGMPIVATDLSSGRCCAMGRMAGWWSLGMRILWLRVSVAYCAIPAWRNGLPIKRGAMPSTIPGCNGPRRFSLN